LKRKLLYIMFYCSLLALVTDIKASEAQASPRFYSGTVHVNKVSSACSNEVVGSTYLLKLMIEETADGYQGYFGPFTDELDVAPTIFFQGSEIDHLSITRSLADYSTLEELMLDLEIDEGSLSGMLRSRHFDYKEEGCRFHELSLIAKQETDEDVILEKFSARYEAEKIFENAQILLQGGKYVETVSTFKRSTDKFKNILGKNAPMTKTSAIMLALLYYSTGCTADAETLLERELEAIEANAKQKHSDIEDALDSLALDSLGTNNLAFAHLIRSVLAMIYDENGRYLEAKALLERSLAMNEKAFGQRHYYTRESVIDLANFLRSSLNRPKEAEALLNRALTIAENSPDLDSSDKVTILINLAELCEGSERYIEAEQFFNRALTLAEKQFGKESPETASCLEGLAGLYIETERYAEAETFLTRTLTIHEETFGHESMEVGNSLLPLSSLYKKMGNYDQAESLLNRALAIEEKFNGRNGSWASLFPLLLASIYESSGRYPEAEETYRRAVAGAIKSVSNKPLLANILLKYASFLKKQGNHKTAIFLSKLSINIIQSFRKSVNEIGKDYLNAYDQLVRDKYELLINLLIEEGRIAEAQQVLTMLKEEEYFDFIQRDASAINKLNTRATFTASEISWLKGYEVVSAQYAKLGMEFGGLRSKAKKSTLSNDEKKRLEQLLQEDSKATAAFNDFLEHLVKSMEEEAKGDADHLEDIGAKGLKSLTSLKSMLKNLGEGSVLLQYIITEDRIHILLTTPDIQLARYSTIKSTALNKKIFDLRESLINTKLDPRPQAKELYDILIGPIVKDLETSQAKTLMLSLDGPLRYLPYAALYDGSAYVAESYRTVMYAEAARDKVVLPAKRHWKVAALGVSEKVREDFPPLPNVPDELNAIVRSDNGGVAAGEIFLNKDFTEASLNESSIRNPVVHIASHFRFVPGTERDSFLLLGDGKTISLAKMRSSSFFQDTELLTLSACDTAMGTSGKGSEIEGFGAIAMNQGAKSVIATLWPVVDKSTAMLMREFYSLKEEQKVSKVEALRQAQLSLLRGVTKEEFKQEQEQSRGSRRKLFKGNADKPYAHPYYWAPFILMGNWK